MFFVVCQVFIPFLKNIKLYIIIKFNEKYQQEPIKSRKES